MSLAGKCLCNTFLHLLPIRKSHNFLVFFFFSLTLIYQEMKEMTAIVAPGDKVCVLVTSERPFKGWNLMCS